MYSHEIQLRVRYGETDQMGFLYYGNYAEYYEVGRVELMRSLGVSYKELEEQNILMPVLDLNSKFIRPAKYDDVLTIRTTLMELPSTRIYFQYEICNQEDILINIGNTHLVFINKLTRKPCKCPNSLLEVLKLHF